MLIAIMMILLLPRRHVILVFLFCTFLIPLGQTLVVAGVHLFVLRIIILSGWVRVFWTKLSSRTNLFSGGFNSVDKAFTLWAVSRALAFILLYWVVGAVINQFGFFWDAFGGYFLLRFLIRDEQDINSAIKCFSVISAILAICMVNEQLSMQNIFGLLGGVRSVPEIRDGWVRCQAAFEHPILAGTFGATLIPLFSWLWKSGKAKSLST